MMETTFNINGKRITVTPTLADKVVNYFDPVKGKARFLARTQMALAGGYTGAKTDRNSLKSWKTNGNDADTDILPDLPALRNNCRDLVRNNPLAAGAINTTVTNVVGTGLKPRPQIDREVLNLSEEEADAWEKAARREFRLWAESKDCDSARQLLFSDYQELAFRQVLENGDVFILLPRFKTGKSPYLLKLQMVEADRVCNKDKAKDSETLSGGVERNDKGAPKNYHILKTHPGSSTNKGKPEWVVIPAFGSKTESPNVIHLFKMLRPGQSRGVPYMAAVIEPLKQLGRFTEAELQATVVASFLTVFIKSPTGTTDLTGMGAAGSSGSNSGTADVDGMELSSGAVLGLLPGEDVSVVSPGRPNTAFDPFVMAVLRQIGVALELPFEVLVKHFTASYSAARAALLEAWRFFNGRRTWLANNLCQPIYEEVITEAVALGRLAAPGFFDDPLIRKAYLGVVWMGDSPGQIDPVKEIDAAEKRLRVGVSTLEEETTALTGGDWESKYPQQVKEARMRKEGGLDKEAVAERIVTEPVQPVAPDDKPDTEEE